MKSIISWLLTTFPSYLKNFCSQVRFWLEMSNYGFVQSFYLWKNTKKMLLKNNYWCHEIKRWSNNFFVISRSVLSCVLCAACDDFATFDDFSMNPSNVLDRIWYKIRTAVMQQVLSWHCISSHLKYREPHKLTQKMLHNKNYIPFFSFHVKKRLETNQFNILVFFIINVLGKPCSYVVFSL